LANFISVERLLEKTTRDAVSDLMALASADRGMGDTIEISVPLWPGLTKITKLRLSGVNAPEIRRASECEKNSRTASKRIYYPISGTGEHYRD